MNSHRNTSTPQRSPARTNMCSSLVCVLLASSALLAITALSPAQEGNATPRVTGKEPALRTQVIINEVNTTAYHKVRVIATVLKDGKPVKGLGPGDLRVREDEVDQEPITVEAKAPPLSVVIALDTSGSMKKQLKDAQTAAISFLEALGAGDGAHIVSFAQEVKPLTRTFSTSRELARAAIQATVARGNTALYDAVYRSLELLQERPGRKAIVLLSDGMDDDGSGKPLSRKKVADVLALAARINAPVYVIGLGKELDEAILQQIATDTGGLYFHAPVASDLQQLYAQIGEQLAGQYSISYTSNLPRDGKRRAVHLTFLREKVTGAKEYTAPEELTAALVSPPKGPEPGPIPFVSKDLPVWVPLMGGSTVSMQVIEVREEEVKGQVWFLSQAAPGDVIGLYREKLRAAGFKIVGSQVAGQIRLEDQNRDLSVVASPGKFFVTFSDRRATPPARRLKLEE